MLAQLQILFGFAAWFYFRRRFVGRSIFGFAIAVVACAGSGVARADTSTLNPATDSRQLLVATTTVPYAVVSYDPTAPIGGQRQLTIPAYHGSVGADGTEMVGAYAGEVVYDPWSAGGSFGELSPRFNLPYQVWVSSFQSTPPMVTMTVYLNQFSHTNGDGTVTSYWYGEAPVAHGCSAPQYFDKYGNSTADYVTNGSVCFSRTAFDTMCVLIDGAGDMASAYTYNEQGRMDLYLSSTSGGGLNFGSTSAVYGFQTGSHYVVDAPGMFQPPTGTPPTWYTQEATNSPKGRYLGNALTGWFGQIVAYYVYPVGHPATTQASTQPTTDQATTKSVNEKEAFDFLHGQTYNDGKSHTGDPTTLPLFQLAKNRIDWANGAPGFLRKMQKADSSFLAKVDDLTNDTAADAAFAEYQALLSGVGIDPSAWAWDTADCSLTWSNEGGSSSNGALDMVNSFLLGLGTLRQWMIVPEGVARFFDDTLLICVVAYRTLRRFTVALGVKRTDFVAPPIGPSDTDGE